MARDPALRDLRDEIDSIDDQIHDLLMRRTRIVGQIGALKRRSENHGLALRPGREAMIIRRIVHRHEGAFPAHALVRIWRELLSAQVGLQGAFSIAVLIQDGDATFGNLARAQFGGGTPMTGLTSTNQVLQRVADGTDSVGVLPMPSSDHPDHWWQGLASANEAVPRVIARLPFAIDRNRRDRPDALAVAVVEPDKTGDDVSLIAVELRGDASRDRLRGAFEACGLAPTWLDSAPERKPDRDRATMQLAAVPDFIGRGDKRLAAIADAVGTAATGVFSIGAYAAPIVIDSDTGGRDS